MTSIYVSDLDPRLFFMLESRGIEHIEDICTACSGAGVRTYPSTSTWRGGIGGQMLTAGVCDHCWGSGNSRRPWPSHREFESMRRAAAKEGASQ